MEKRDNVMRWRRNGVETVEQACAKAGDCLRSLSSACDSAGLDSSSLSIFVCKLSSHFYLSEIFSNSKQ